MGKKGHHPPQSGKNGSWALLTGLCAGICFFAFFLYVDTLNAGFVWDDHNLVEMRKPPESLRDFARAWSSGFWETKEAQARSQYYRPLTTTFFLLDLMLHDHRPRGFHLTNIILYAGVCALGFLILQELIGSLWISFPAALLFTALSCHTENTAWIAGRTDLVCALFMFGSLLLYLKSEEGKRKGLFAVSLFLFMLSLFGKEMSITLPAVVFLHRLARGDKPGQALKPAIFFAAASVPAMLPHLFSARHAIPEQIYTTPSAFALNALRNLSYGLWFSLVPGGFHYLVTAAREQAAATFPAPRGPFALLALFPLCFVASVAVFSWFKGKKEISFALGSALVSLIPVSGVVPIGAVFGIRFLLIPSFFMVVASGYAAREIETRGWSLPGLRMNPGIAVLLGLSLIHAGATFLRVPAWRSDVTLMESVLEKKPESPLAHFILGNGLFTEGRTEEAEKHYKEAVRLRPEYAEAEYNLGLIALRQGRGKEAEARFRRVLSYRPGFRPAREALARLLLSQGQRQEAAALLSGGGRH